jgi:hypothetical protein
VMWGRMRFGGGGIYVGGKDTFVSELTGNYSITAEVGPSVAKAGGGGRVARIVVQLGAAAPPVQSNQLARSGG